MKTAIVHEWLVNYAGSERVVESFTNIFPDADVFSLVDFLNDEQRQIILKDKRANTSFIQKLPLAKKKHRYYLPLFPKAIEKLDLSGYDLMLSSSHAVTKGIRKSSNQLHISYVHSPMRYAWDQQEQYLSDAKLNKGMKGMFVRSIMSYLRKWDISTASRPDFLIANSNFIAGKIKRIYNRDSPVIYPPVDVEKFLCTPEKDNYYLTASRMVPYKRIDLVVEAFAEMPDKKLIVIGHGPELEKIKSKAKKNIEMLGYQPDNVLKDYLQKAKAFVFAAEEDFGIIIVEAMACGTPVIALKRGGTAETVIDGKTGILFEGQDVNAIKDAVDRFENTVEGFSPEFLREHSENFNRHKFEEKILLYVNNKCDMFFNRKNHDR